MDKKLIIGADPAGYKLKESVKAHLIEQGYDITYYTQRGMAAPLGVDDAIMTRLEEACAAAIEDPDFVTFMNNNGQAISYLDAQGYADYLKQAAVDVAAAMDAVGL